MVLSHTGLVLVAIGLTPALARVLPAAAAMDSRRLVVLLGAGLVGLGGVLAALAAAWPEYGHQLLTREWGLVEPLQFTLYLVAARLCFTIAYRSGARLASRRMYRLGGWGFRLFALEEIDYLGVPSSLARLAGVEGSRIGQSYVGALHDAFNVAAQYGVVWVPVLIVALGALCALWWVSGGRVAPILDMLSWRLLPALAGVSLLGLAQAKDVHDEALAFGERSRLLNVLLEEPVELLAILLLNITLVLEAVRRDRRAELDRPIAA